MPSSGTFAPGFRFSLLDGVVLAAGVPAVIALSMIEASWGFVVGFVIGHFFLFCNVVRMARPLELIWSGVFVLLAAATIALDVPGWPITAALSLVVTLLLVVIEMRRPSYHGVFWCLLNPGLPAW